MYRLSSSMFPFADWAEQPVYQRMLLNQAYDLAIVGQVARAGGLRLVMHPNQFCVLSTDSPEVLQHTLHTLEHHAWVMDALGCPESTWSALNLHGGKRDRLDALVRVIQGLPTGIRSRLTLENCEYGYSVAQLVTVAERTATPVLLDFHHEAVHFGLPCYDCGHLWKAWRQARETWADPEQTLTHLSNGIDGIGDRRHADYLTDFPLVAKQAPYLEVEAKAKELAIFRLTQ